MYKVLQQNIIKELGIDNLPEKEKEEMLLRIGKIIFQDVMFRVVEILSEKDQDEMSKLFDETAGDDEGDKVLDFLRSKIDNFDDIVGEEIVKFKEESVDIMQSIKK
ncbi:MAG: hypothetical protein AAB614_01810 [Patescibacteria group bacterium]